VLWKSVSDDAVGWDSPWGYGRPGWHIECSAMATCALGNTFDIHGGGSDLMFPHHENEIAQSEAATGETFANLWMHNGPLRIDDEKMSKSLDNFFTVREVLQHHKAEVVRNLLISSHYRSPINYSEQSLVQSAKALERFYHCLKDLDIANAKSLTNSRYEKAFVAAMDDDFNTPEAFSVMFEMVSEINTDQGNRSRPCESTRVRCWCAWGAVWASYRLSLLLFCRLQWVLRLTRLKLIDWSLQEIRLAPIKIGARLTK
jgi:cysteinyl-tRNA synthetase